MSSDIKHHIKIYRNVFIGLLLFTGLTVGASYINFSVIWVGIGLGILIAFVKGYLVASNFMHLNNEKSLIYTILAFTVLFFVVVFFVPSIWNTQELHSPEHIPMQNGEVFKENNQQNYHQEDGGHH